MSKNSIKDSKYIILGYVVFALIILAGLVSKFSFSDLFYFIAVTIFVIRYFIVIAIKK